MSNIDDDDCEDDMNDGISPPTPGPWRVIASWYDHMVEGPNGEQIIWQDGPYGTPTIKLSDARLIAAAPEMYEALRMFLAYNDQGGPLHFDTDAMWAKARNVLAKIGGGEK